MRSRATKKKDTQVSSDSLRSSDPVTCSPSPVPSPMACRLLPLACSYPLSPLRFLLSALLSPQPPVPSPQSCHNCVHFFIPSDISPNSCYGLPGTRVSRGEVFLGFAFSRSLPSSLSPVPSPLSPGTFRGRSALAEVRLLLVPVPSPQSPVPKSEVLVLLSPPSPIRYPLSPKVRFS
jgi:hypothetical protein